MIFAQYHLDCPSQASHLIGDETTGRAVVVEGAATSRGRPTLPDR
ncbi:hypothetical protein [Nocardiopsis sp. EMB25]|nr:hypothetical protein [Nocardiopsis sp. EMB25]